MWLASGAEFDFVLTSAPVIILQGAGTTILVSALAIMFATILAVFGALARLSTNPIPNAIGSFYVSLFRGTPLLRPDLFAYFALPQLGLVLPARSPGVTALSLNYGAYMTEIFRAGIQAVPGGQREAAEALGMPERLHLSTNRSSAGHSDRHPGHRQRVHRHDQGHSLVSIITVQELLWRASASAARSSRRFAAFLLAAARVLDPDDHLQLLPGASRAAVGAADR